MRIIDADELKALRELYIQGKLQFIGNEYDLIDKCPTIDAEPVRHGRWINPHLNKYGHPCHQCSECLFGASQKDRNYCPDCGAKMDLKE